MDIFHSLFDSVQLERPREDIEAKDITHEAAAAKNAVVAKMGYAARFSAFEYQPIGRKSSHADFGR